MTGEKDPRDVMQAEHDARLSEHSAFRAPPEMPGVEEIARAICIGNPDDCVFGTAGTHEPMVCHKRRWQEHAGQARAVLNLFAPILAEKELHHVTGERITRKDLNNAHRKGAEEGRLAAHLIDGVNSPLNACCYREQCKALEARALAAEAALAAARAEYQSLRAVYDASLEVWGQHAAAIRAQGE